MSLSQEQLDAIFEPIDAELRSYGSDVGFLLVAVSQPFTVEEEDGHVEQYQPFLMHTNAAHIGAICGLMSRALEKLGEMETIIIKPGELN